MRLKSISSFTYFSVILGVLILMYLLFRAFWVEPIHDELATLFHYVDYGTIWGENTVLDANNHLLNSYLSKICYSIFGDHIWAIRLPNVFSFLLYFFATYKIALLFNKSTLRYAFVIAMTTTPYLLDYFAYCRGYGMSMAFLIASFYFFIQINKRFSTKNLVLLAILALLGIYANLNLVITYFIIFGYIGIKIFIESRQKNKYNQLYIYLSISILVALALIPAIYFSFILKLNGALYYGNFDGLWLTTGTSISKLILFSTSFIIKYALILSILLFVFHLIYTWVKKGGATLFGNTSTLFIGVFIGNLIAIELLRWLMGINYPEDRVGMHLILLFIGSSLFVLDNYSKYHWFGLLFCLLPVIGIKHFNFNTSVFSPDDRIEQKYFDFLISQLHEGNPTLAIYNTQILTYAYHVRKNNPTNFYVPRRYLREQTFDEEIVSSKIDGVNEYKSKGYDLLKYNPRTWQTILKRKKEYNWEIMKVINSKSPVSTSEKYYSLIDSTWTRVNSSHLKFEFECKVNTPHLNRETLVFVVDYTDLKGNNNYSSFNLNWSSGRHREYTFKKALEISPSNLKDLRVYLFNPNTNNYTILYQNLTLKVAD